MFDEKLNPLQKLFCAYVCKSTSSSPVVPILSRMYFLLFLNLFFVFHQSLLCCQGEGVMIMLHGDAWKCSLSLYRPLFPPSLRPSVTPTHPPFFPSSFPPSPLSLLPFSLPPSLPPSRPPSLYVASFYESAVAKYTVSKWILMIMSPLPYLSSCLTARYRRMWRAYWMTPPTTERSALIITTVTPQSLCSNLHIIRIYIWQTMNGFG